MVRKKVGIQGFIFNWKGHESGAASLEDKIGNLIKVTVINSEENLRARHSHWVHLDDTAYFSTQWNRAVKLFDADILFHIQADAEFNQFDELMTKAEFLYGQYRLGAYEPNVDYTDIKYDKAKLRTVEEDLFEVPFTDCTCWFIHGSIVRELPPVDISINRFGWGIPRAIAALCRMNGRLCLRDYNFTVQHPKARGYPSAVAMRQLDAYKRSLSPMMQKEISRLQQERELLRFQ